MGFEQEAMLAIDKLHCLVEGEYLGGYEIAKLMPDSLLEAIEGGAYALTQELCHMTERQTGEAGTITEEEYYDNRT